MNDIGKQILENYQVRKTRKQKQVFRSFIIAELMKHGYDPKEEKIGCSTNIVIGDIDSADIIYTAHYDTCAVLPFPNYIIPTSFFGYLLSQFFILSAIIIISLLASFVIYCFFLIFDLEVHVYYYILLFLLLWAYFGKPNKHTANDNTSGVVTIVDAAIKMKEETRSKVCFILFDNEEMGLLGSSALAKKNKNVKKHKLVMNFDCVSDGDYLCFFPSKLLKEEVEISKLVESSFMSKETKHIIINKGFGFYPSDNLNFKKSYGVCSLKKGIFYYMNRIHTSRDTVFDEINIEVLSDGICNFSERYTSIVDLRKQSNS